MNNMCESIIDSEYLNKHPDHIFVFGDNTLHKGTKGAASLRFHNQSRGFITKKRPSYDDSAYYRPVEYKRVFREEMERLEKDIKCCPHLTFLISKLGSGLANKYGIYEKIIKEGLRPLRKYQNVKFLFDLDE